MKTREQVIDGMCMTYRHDFGLLSEDKKDGLRRIMKQIYEHNIAPYMEFKPPPPPPKPCIVCTCGNPLESYNHNECEVVIGAKN